MNSYHYAWLSVHPHRTEEWLADRLKDGFDVHHMDGDHSNDDPLNLILIDGADHMMLHNGKTRLSRITRKPREKQIKKAPAVLTDEEIHAHMDVLCDALNGKRLPNGMLASYAKAARKVSGKRF